MPVDRRWAIILHSGAGCQQPPPEGTAWTDDAFRNTARLLQAPIYPIKKPDIPQIYDAFLFCSIWIGDLATEIAWVQDIRRRGKKAVITFSHDGRFAGGHALINEHGHIYSDLVAAADLTLTGVPEDINLFGRHKNKCMSSGGFLERVNLSPSYDKRDIDILVSGPRNEDFFGLSAEVMLSLLASFPGRKIIYCARSTGPCSMNTFAKAHPEVPFVYGKLTGYLPRAKVHLNLDWRPSPGRSVMESWYYRTPTVGSKLTYYSKLYPDLIYQNFCVDQIIDKCRLALSSDYNALIAKASTIAENEYFEVVYKNIVNRIDGR